MNIGTFIQKSICTIPDVEGPIPVTKESYPFCSADHSRTPFHLEQYGYVEEEYFLSGTANVYEQSKERELAVKLENQFYKNRILVRRPKTAERFSGRVYVDIINASAKYDIEDLWHRNYLWCVKNGHAYVGITSKPVCVQSLKNFDYKRYHSLSWNSAVPVPQPVASNLHTIPGTEEGLVWDIISQTAYLIRHGDKQNCIGGFQPEYVYLTGQSQSGMYLNTYITAFDPFLYDEEGKAFFDGYLNMVGAFFQRTLCQEDRTTFEINAIPQKPVYPPKPFISITSEGDLYIFAPFGGADEAIQEILENADEENHKCRYYEFPGSPHTNIVCPLLSPNTDVARAQRSIADLSSSILDGLNDFPLEDYICGLLDKLHIWVTQNIAPEIAPTIERDGNGLAKDRFGNSKGGFRTPFVDVPIARYIAANPAYEFGACGKMVLFTKEQFVEEYGTKEAYFKKFSDCVDKQEQNGWISADSAQKMKAWAECMSERILRDCPDK